MSVNPERTLRTVSTLGFVQSCERRKSFQLEGGAESFRHKHFLSDSQLHIYTFIFSCLIVCRFNHSLFIQLTFIQVLIKRKSCSKAHVCFHIFVAVSKSEERVRVSAFLHSVNGITQQPTRVKSNYVFPFLCTGLN